MRPWNSKITTNWENWLPKTLQRPLYGRGAIAPTAPPPLRIRHWLYHDSTMDSSNWWQRSITAVYMYMYFLSSVFCLNYTTEQSRELYCSCHISSAALRKYTTEVIGVWETADTNTYAESMTVGRSNCCILLSRTDSVTKYDSLRSSRIAKFLCVKIVTKFFGTSLDNFHIQLTQQSLKL